MKTFRLLSLACLLLTLTACKIDLSIFGTGSVKTDSGSIDCSTGTTGDCNQEYVTDMQECDAAGNCTLVTTSTTETFNALPGDNSSFGGWGELCFGLANQSCSHTITSEYAAENDVLNVTATFDPEPAPQDATYTYNHLGQRASKTTGGTTTYFVYSDLDGQLIGEYTSTGSPIREYIYLEGERVAMYDHTTVEPKDSTNTKAIVYLHNDQVGQVQYAYNSDGQIIYERVQTPFGETMSEMNAYNVQIPVRFPGQYYDSETGFNQNWNRDYDSSLGRYVQSDPIGLMGGINTYGYVMQNPGMWVDPKGLDVTGAIGTGIAGGGSYGGLSGTAAAKGVTSGAKSGAENVKIGIAGQIGTTTGSTISGAGQSSSVGIGVYIEICDGECNDPNGGGVPLGSMPDGVGVSSPVVGVSVKTDGTMCVLLGPSLSWPPGAAEWNIPPLK
jgi:RHS repeat-associated protein